MSEAAKEAWQSLTETQREVLVLMARGLSSKQVGTYLGLPEPTVKSRLYYAFARLGISKITQAATLCALAGAVTDWR